MKKPGYLLGAATAGLVKGVSHIFPKTSAVKYLAMISESVTPEITIEAGGKQAKFAGVSRDAARMPLTWFYHEAETVNWLRTHLQPGETFWDIGANVGIFSIFAAMDRGVQVVAFEPSAQTFGTLYRNIYLNDLGEEISAFCVALGDSKEVGKLHLTEVSSGTALHSYGRARSGGVDFKPSFSQGTICYPGDAFRAEYGLAAPDHIKIDVDGNEPYVLAGLAETLKSVKSILIERNEEEAVRPLMDAAGLRVGTIDGPDSETNRLYIR